MQKTRFRTALAGALLAALAGCDAPEPPSVRNEIDDREGLPPPATIESTGKSETALVDLPREVVAAVLAIRPGLTLVAAEYETREDREYYDVAGFMPDDTEVELDLTRVDGDWTVVEIQRDIALDAVPPAVARTLASEVSDFEPARIIESDQRNGTVIYEFFGPGAAPVKHEIRWADGDAELLREEWMH